MGWLWLSVILLAVGAAFFLLFSWIQITVYYLRKKENDHFHVDIHTLFGLIHYRYHIPELKLRGKGLYVKSEKINRRTSEKLNDQHEHITIHDIQQSVHKGIEFVEHILGFSDWLKQSVSHFQLRYFRWVTYIGLKDAPSAALASGLLWTVKSNVLTFLSRFMQWRAQPRVNIVPIFDHAQFSTELRCIGRIRIGYAMLAGLLLFARLLRVKGGMKACRNILFKA